VGRDGSGVRAASETSIEITFTYQGKRCRERIALKPTAANLQAAERHRAAILDAIARGTFDYAVTFPESKHALARTSALGTATTLESWLATWLDRSKPTLKASTYITHKRIARRLTEGLGQHTLTALRWRDIRQWVEDQKVGGKTANNLLSVLRSALQVAVDDDLIEASPLDGHRLKRPKSDPHPGDEIDPFSSEERAAILAAAEGQERNLIQFAMWTGLRISELCALDWSDVDLVGGTVRITRALTQLAKDPEAPKTAAGRRTVKLLSPARDAILAQRVYTETTGKAVFQNPRTNARWPGDLTFRQGAWTRILRNAEVRYRYPYQLRHTYASMMLMAGEKPQWLATQLGHRDWTFTARTYARWIAVDAPDAGGLAEKAWA
jgi:integrase